MSSLNCGVLPAMIAKLISLGQPYAPTSRADATQAPVCFLGPADPVATATDLIADFGDKDPRTSGLVEDGPCGAVALATAFTAPSGPLLLVTAPGEEAPGGLIGPNRTAPLGRLPVELLLNDLQTQKALRECGNVLLLTTSNAAAAAYRALGVPAAPFEPLADMDPAQRQELFDVLRAGPPVPPPPDVPASQVPAKRMVGGLEISDGYYRTAPSKKNVAKRRGTTSQSSAPPPVVPPITVRIAAWSPHDAADVDEARLKNDAAWIANAERLTHGDLGDVAFWSPTEAEQADLKWLLQFGASADIRNALYRSLANSSFAPSRFARTDLRPPGAASNLAEANSDLADAIYGAEGAAAIAEARESVRRHEQQSLVQPLFDLALAAPTPLDRARLVAAAHETVIGQTLAGELQSAMARLTADPQGGLSAADVTLLREHSKSVDRMLRLHKSLT